MRYFLGAFAKLPKDTISFAVSLRSIGPSARMEQLVSNRTDFRKIYLVIFFRKSFDKIQVSFKYD